MADKQVTRGKALTLQGFKLLIVEDYPFMADLMGSMLREFGVGNIFQAISVAEAKEMLILFNTEMDPRSAIDMVITDWLMPGTSSGTDLISWVREHRKDTVKFLPVILCSAYASEDLVKVARDCGANEALVKPVSANSLAKRLLHVINNPRPFLQAPDFFGPDRRRREEEYDGEEQRKIQPEEIKEFHERL